MPEEYFLNSAASVEFPEQDFLFRNKGQAQRKE